MAKISGELMLKFMTENSIMVSLSEKSCRNIMDGSKTVIVMRTCPEVNKYMRREGDKLVSPRFSAFIFNKKLGVVGKCVVSMMHDRKVFSAGYGSNRHYREDPEYYASVVRLLDETVDLQGTCLTIEEFRRLVGIREHGYFQIHSYERYAPALSVDDFWIGWWGKNGEWTPGERFKYPKTWCYAIKKE